MLSALAPESLARLRFPLGELHKDEVRELAERRGPGGRAQARLAGPVLPGGHAPAAPSSSATAASARTPGPIVDRDGARARRARAARTPTPSASATALAFGAGEPLYVLATDTRANTVTVGPRSGAADERAAPCAS